MEINKIICGDALIELKKFPNDCIDTIITSPPYWGLRDYEVEGQIGLEKTLEKYLKKLLRITEELKRVLKPTGVMFWNHGDCYGNSAGRNNRVGEPKGITAGIDFKINAVQDKCLVFQNYRLILKMIDEQGWILRNTIIWHKPNSMPSSVKDRFSNSYDPVFMMVKNKKYWFDLDAVRKPSQSFEPFNIRKRKGKAVGFMASPPETTKISKDQAESFGSPRARQHRKEFNTKMAGGGSGIKGHSGYYSKDGKLLINPAGKNPGDVWKIPTQPFPEAHFATFPEKLVEPMIKSSCPTQICKKCGKARVRIVKTELINQRPHKLHKGRARESVDKNSPYELPAAFARTGIQGENQYKTIGWTDCGCNAGWKAGIVLDPFMGSGTVAVVAEKLRRNWLGIEIKPEYIKIAKGRLKQKTLI